MSPTKTKQAGKTAAPVKSVPRMSALSEGARRDAAPGSMPPLQRLRAMPMGRGAGPRARDVRAMHGTLGARRTAQLMRKGQGDEAMRVQPKLEVGPPNDAYEREADATAQRVMRMGGGACCPSCAEGKECEVQPARIRRMAGEESAGMPVPAELEPRIQTMQRGGEPLPDQVRAKMEPRFGQNFSDVRIHRDPEAANTAQALDAKAYTLGSHIAFNTGQYAPGTASGDHLLAHELTHVAQRSSDRGLGSIVQRACGKQIMPPPPGCVLVSRQPSAERYLFVIECDDFAPGEEARLIGDVAAAPAGTIVHILGMASSDGPTDLNESLSCWRAAAAENALTRAGFGGVVESVEAAGPMGPPGDATFRAVAIEYSTPPPLPAEPESSTVRYVACFDGRTLIVSKNGVRHQCEAISGNIGRGPTPEGDFCIREQGATQTDGHDNWFLLEPLFETDRSRMHLHPGQRSSGCVTVSEQGCFGRAAEILAGPGRVTEPGHDGCPPGNLDCTQRVGCSRVQRVEPRETKTCVGRLLVRYRADGCDGIF